MNKNVVIERLKSYNINPAILKNYDEEHRHYHNWEHIDSLLTYANSFDFLTDTEEGTILFLAIIFHDIIYNPKSLTNEEDSVLCFKEEAKLSLHITNKVNELIMSTKQPSKYTVDGRLRQLDLHILNSSYIDLLKYENKIYKEYQYIDYCVYKKERLKFLSFYATTVINPSNIYALIDYIENRKPNIAVYAGSFNPFHKGHYNVLTKAERVFDKIIIARGVNPDKNDELMKLPKVLDFRQVEQYNGLLTDFINNLEYDITLIRGLRNTTDLQYELTQYRYLQELKPNIKVISIFCDKEYEHVSSSAIKQLEKFNKHKEYLV